MRGRVFALPETPLHSDNRPYDKLLNKFRNLPLNPN